MANPHPVSKFEKGNTAALGNDKTLRISTWINKELSKQLGDPHASVLGYEAEIERRQAIARRLIDLSLQSKDNTMAMSAIKEVIDRTEGKPAQSIDLTSKGEKLSNLSDEAIDARIKELEARITES